MVDITILELNLPESTFTANLPFGDSGRSSDDTSGVQIGSADAESDMEEADGKGKALAIVGTFVFLVIAVALVKYLTGDDEDHEVEIETPDEPVGVTIDEDDE